MKISKNANFTRTIPQCHTRAAYTCSLEREILGIRCMMNHLERYQGRI